MTTASFPNIKLRTFSEFRGPEASICGTRLLGRHIVSVYRALNNDPPAVAAYYELDVDLVNEALRYAELHSEEIEAAIREEEMWDEEYFRRMYPHLLSQPAPDQATPQ
jgi:hypothetical protein